MRARDLLSGPKTRFALAILCSGVVGPACGGGDSGGPETTDAAASVDGGSADGGSLPDGGMVPVSVWVPKAIDFHAYLTLDFVPEAAAAGLAVSLVEAPLSPAQLGAATRTGLTAHTIATDYVLLPELLARALVREGLLSEPAAILFSHADPDLQPYLLGLALARPVPAMPAGQASSAALSRLTQAQGLDWKTAEPVVVAVLQKGAQKGVEKGTEVLLDKYGFTTAARFVGTRAVPAIAFAQTAWKVGKVVNASYQVVEAKGGASVSAIETIFQGISSLQSLLPGLYALRVDIKACAITAPDANAVLDHVQSRAALYQRVAFAAIVDLAVLGRETPQFQLVDNAMAKVLELSTELRRLANLKGGTAADPMLKAGARAILNQIIDDNADANRSLQTFAELLTGQTLGNPFIHSDGFKMSIARGPVDIRFRGATRIDLSVLALSTLFGTGGTFPCGKTTPSERVLCGRWPLAAGPAMLVATVFDAPIPQVGATYYQYGTVFEDVKLSGVYQASAAFPKDLFKNTNVWYTNNYSPSGGWTLKRQMAIGSAITEVDTSSLTILKDNALIQIIPQGEIGSEPAPYRSTAFSHGGDWGAMMPFSGDTAPDVEAPLWPWLSGPYATF